jgi:hypothetical protein
MTQNEFAALMKQMDEEKAERDRQWKLTLREFRLGRRAYEEGLALCVQLMDRGDKMFAENIHALREMRREMGEHRVETREEARAQREALFKMIDRMDRLDGGTSAA